MIRFSRNLLAAALSLAVVPAALAAHTHVATPSTWVLDVSASDFGGGPALKSDVTVVLTDTDKWLKYTDVAVDGDGKTMKTSWSGPADGTMKPIVGMPGGKFSVTAATDTQILVLPDGTTFTAVFSLSDDKKAITFKQDAKTKDGKVFHQTLVYKLKK